ncbi:MAG: replication associated protein [Microviridae sp. ctOsc38]|nr:MAG: replication associated protein [Microviridae sp. ctOsc38]
MACHRPLYGYVSRTVNPSGKRSTVWNAREGYYDLPRTLRCGKCDGCCLDWSASWAVRCIHEASLHENNIFLTLTYADEFLPEGGTLVKADWQKFMKRLRKRYGAGARYFHCGEYGKKKGRPHYHALLFNFEFDDQVKWRKTRGGYQTFRSPSLEELWPFGHSEIGSVTFDSAAYVARYILKKVRGPEAEAHYEGRIPEYLTMSRRPGIGKDWIRKHSADVYGRDVVVIPREGGARMLRPPRYYDAHYEVENPEGYANIRAARRLKAREAAEKAGAERLGALEKIAALNVSRQQRGYESEAQDVFGFRWEDRGVHDPLLHAACGAGDPVFRADGERSGDGSVEVPG